MVCTTQCEDLGLVDDHWLVFEAGDMVLEGTVLGLDRDDLGICGEKEVSDCSGQGCPYRCGELF